MIEKQALPDRIGAAMASVAAAPSWSTELIREVTQPHNMLGQNELHGDSQSPIISHIGYAKHVLLTVL